MITMRVLIADVSTLLIISILLLQARSIEPSNIDGEVVLVNVLFRHGDRTPVNPYPLDPYRNLSYWPTEWGQLTKSGMQQHYELGEWLRKRYGALLSNGYKKSDIYIQSTDSDRTLMSAESNLAGLFPPHKERLFEPELKWQPIPIHTVPEHLDHLLAMKKPCPQYDAEIIKARNLPEIKTLTEKYQDVFKYLSIHSGSDVKTMENAEYIHSTLFIESLYNFTLPTWTKSVYPEPLKTIAQWSFAFPTYTKELRRLKGGPLIGEWVDHFVKKRAGDLDPNRKMYIYSAHDVTIANILNTLNLFEHHCPPYASTVLVELRKSGDDYFVALFYKNSSTAHLLTLPGCTSLCKLDTFFELVKPIIPEHWEKECHYHGFFAAEDFNKLSISALSLAGILAVTSLGLLLTIFIRQRRLQTDPFRYRTVSTYADS